MFRIPGGVPGGVKDGDSRKCFSGDRKFGLLSLMVEAGKGEVHSTWSWNSGHSGLKKSV